MTLIVIINSKSGLAHAIEMALQNAGYNTLVASHAQEAIDLLTGESPQLILLGDTCHTMLQQASILKNHLLTQQSPILLQSTDYSILNLAYQQRLGVQAVLNNPYSTSQLIQAVNQWVGSAV